MQKPTTTKADVITSLNNGDFSHMDKVQLLALFLDDLQAGSVQYVANNINKSYNGVKDHRQVLHLGGLKIAIPNENEIT